MITDEWSYLISDLIHFRNSPTQSAHLETTSRSKDGTELYITNRHTSFTYLHGVHFLTFDSNYLQNMDMT